MSGDGTVVPLRKPLSDRERAALDFIRSHCNDVGYPPTVRQIGTEIGVASTSQVSVILLRIAAKGYIRVDQGVVRGIVLLDHGEDAG